MKAGDEVGGAGATISNLDIINISFTRFGPSDFARRRRVPHQLRRVMRQAGGLGDLDAGFNSRFRRFLRNRPSALSLVRLRPRRNRVLLARRSRRGANGHGRCDSTSTSNKFALDSTGGHAVSRESPGTPLGATIS